jgi:hypothetical protein
MVKKVVREAGIPYSCLMGEVDVLNQIPGFQGFPTTVIVDRAGKVRTIITENSKLTLDFIADVVRVLLAEPAKKSDAAAKQSAPKPGVTAKKSSPDKPDVTAKQSPPKPDSAAKDSTPKPDAAAKKP